MRRLLRATRAGVFLLAIAGPATAQDLPDGFDETFAVSSLDSLLTLGADAVVRLEVLRFEVHDPGRATRTVRRAVTVLNPGGRDEGELYIFYDNRLRRLKKLTGQISDANGKVVRKLAKADQEDFSAISGYSHYGDGRVRVARLYYDTYPYTVEFEYEVLHDGLVNWPTWYPQQEGIPVVLGRFDLVTAPDVAARYTVQGGALEPEVSQQGSRNVLRWEIREEPAVEVEPFGPVWQDQVIAVHTAPTAFEVEGTQGDMSSWRSFGQWYHTLNDGRTALPPDARNEVHRVTSGLSDVREKVRRLYTYMQEKTRYVSIQLGLGGWQTFDAAYVHERGYGDCKALSNYMQALLDEAGIASFPALIHGGSRAPEVLTSFASNQFNHVILYVDLGDGEEIWLENTDQTIPFGHLGNFTEGRYALLVRPGGGKLVRTPRSEAHQNQRVLHAQVILGPLGDATAQVQTRHTGNEQDEIRQHIANRSGRERELWLDDYIDVPNFEIVSADLSAVDARTLSLALSITLTLPRYAARTGKRLFLPVNLLHRWTYVPRTTEERTQPVEFFPHAFSHVDTVRYELPEGFVVEAIPDPVEVETAFGWYVARAEVEPGGTLVYYRRVEVAQAVFPAEHYDAFRDFMRQISQADHAQVVLVAQ
jgi:hypothetical protein